MRKIKWLFFRRTHPHDVYAMVTASALDITSCCGKDLVFKFNHDRLWTLTRGRLPVGRLPFTSQITSYGSFRSRFAVSFPSTVAMFDSGNIRWWENVALEREAKKKIHSLPKLPFKRTGNTERFCLANNATWILRPRSQNMKENIDVRKSPVQ